MSCLHLTLDGRPHGDPVTQLENYLSFLRMTAKYSFGVRGPWALDLQDPPKACCRTAMRGLHSLCVHSITGFRWFLVSTHLRRRSRYQCAWVRVGGDITPASCRVASPSNTPKSGADPGELIQGRARRGLSSVSAGWQPSGSQNM